MKEHIKNMKNNTLAAIHGALAKQILTAEEHHIYEGIKKDLRDEYDLDPAADEIILDMIGFAAAKLWVAKKFGVKDAIRRYIKEIDQHLNHLGIRRDDRLRLQREGTSKDPQNWSLAFMERMEKGMASLPPGRPRIIDVEATDVPATATTEATEGDDTGGDGDRASEAKSEGEE